MEIDERLKPLEILRTINGCIVIRSSLYGESVYELMDNAIAHIREELERRERLVKQWAEDSR
jgi:hypothetical protein